jgi:hypothetical protein
MTKTLYFSHIPKTGGKALQNLIPILEQNGLSVFTRDTAGFEGYEKFAYIQTHYGAHPMEVYPEVDTACIFRDPIDRMVSHFAWNMMEKYYEQYFDEYKTGKTEDLFRYFLFEDEKLANNNNLQTKFVCNSIDGGAFYAKHVSPVGPNGEALDMSIYLYESPFTSWLMRNDNTSIEFAKEQIDKMVIIDTIENHDRFVTNICNWFKENYNLDIEEEFKASLVNENPTVNYSIFTDSDGIEWTTAKLKALLTDDEKARVYANNSLDLEIYNYVKSKVA